MLAIGHLRLSCGSQPNQSDRFHGQPSFRPLMPIMTPRGQGSDALPLSAAMGHTDRML